MTSPRQEFHFGTWIFDVTAAEKLIGPDRRTVPIDVAGWAHAYGLDRDNPSTVPLLGPGPEFDREYAMTTDLSRPLLLATVPRVSGEPYALLIDGTHRIYKAWREGVPELAAHELTEQETAAIVLRRPGQSTRSARQHSIPRPRSGKDS
jgi:hypothetical protein